MRSRPTAGPVRGARVRQYAPAPKRMPYRLYARTIACGYGRRQWSEDPPIATVIVQSAALLPGTAASLSLVIGREMLHASQLLQVRERGTKDLLGNPRSLHPRLEGFLHLLARVDVVAEVTYLTGVS